MCAYSPRLTPIAGKTGNTPWPNTSNNNRARTEKTEANLLYSSVVDGVIGGDNALVHVQQSRMMEAGVPQKKPSPVGTNRRALRWFGRAIRPIRSGRPRRCCCSTPGSGLNRAKTCSTTSTSPPCRLRINGGEVSGGQLPIRCRFENAGNAVWSLEY